MRPSRAREFLIGLSREIYPIPALRECTRNELVALAALAATSYANIVAGMIVRESILPRHLARAALFHTSCLRSSADRMRNESE